MRTSTICFVPHSSSSSSWTTTKMRMKTVRGRRATSVRRTAGVVMTATWSQSVTAAMTCLNLVVDDRQSTRCSARSARRPTTRPVCKLMQHCSTVPRPQQTQTVNRLVSQSISESAYQLRCLTGWTENAGVDNDGVLFCDNNELNVRT